LLLPTDLVSLCLTIKHYIYDDNPVATLKYLLKTPTNPNYKYEEMKGVLNSENTCNRSMQILLSFRLPSKKKIKVCTTVLVSVGLYGCETWFLMTGRT
jgi:hypothetical protein